MLREPDRIRLRHMADAASQAITYARGRNRSELETDPPLCHLLVRNMEIMGEAASRISPEVRATHSEIPWGRIVNTRHRLIHAYYDIDLDIVWSTVQHALPELLSRIQAILKNEERD